MGIQIDDLDPTVLQSRGHEVPAMKDGVTVKLTVAQILGLIQKGDFISLFNAGDVVFAPTGTIASATVQAALAELGAEKLALAGGTMSGAIDMANFAINNPAGLLLSGKLYGLTLSNDTGGDVTNDVIISAGQAASDASVPVLINLASAMTKRTDAAWAAGTGNGGWLDGTSMPDGTGLAFLIWNPTTNTADVGFSASASPTLPTGYTHKRRIGSILRASSAIRLFRQINNRFMLITGVVARSSTAAFADALLTVTAPLGIRTRPILTNILNLNVSSSAQNAFGDGDGSAAQFIGQTSAGSDTAVIDQVYTNLSAQIRYSATINAGSLVQNDLRSIGWWDDRGINA